ncbi:MAG: hypothetical protein AABZ06_10515 [Bdellovibrionota bacterium]
MPAILDGLPTDIRVSLESIKADSCILNAQWMKLTSELDLNTNAINQCDSDKPTSALSLISGTTIDEPDRGIDENLPEGEKYDPLNERRWMGGLTGPTSKGFRHMYFGGWKLSRPLATFQIPLRPVGQAPQRVYLVAEHARTALKNGDKTLAMRLLTWAAHYIQDLGQPFHSTQVLSLRMVPWGSLFNLVSETTRTISNYHWAYEEYVLLQLQPGRFQNQDLLNCLRAPEKYASISIKKSDPKKLAQLVAAASTDLAPKLGAAMMSLFGTTLKQSDVNLPLNKGRPDYAAYLTRPEFENQRREMDSGTCAALSNTSLATRLLIEWALYP